MRGTRWARLAVGLFAISLVLAACSSDNGGGTTTGGGTTATTGATGASGGTTGGGSGTTITIQGFAFHPDTVPLSSGQTTLTITNQDSTTHTFTLDDGSVDEDVPAGQTITVTVDLSQTTGFHCKIHTSMTGTLQVG
jgi:plastocyanin